MYTVYRTTNIQNGKYYIGVHKTDDPYDSYLGSGRAIEEAIRKYGRNSFTKEILLITESKDEAYKREADLTVDFNTNSNYNMRRGGVGGFTKENARKGHEKVRYKFGSIGGKASMAKLTPEERTEKARQAAYKRWKKQGSEVR